MDNRQAEQEIIFRRNGKDITVKQCELKTFAQVGLHFPRRDADEKGKKGVGVDRTTIYRHIQSGRLKLDVYWFHSRMYLYVPMEDQLKDKRTWCLDKRYSARRRGRPSNKELLGLV
jgi:hypothetical protein